MYVDVKYELIDEIAVDFWSCDSDADIHGLKRRCKQRNNLATSEQFIDDFEIKEPPRPGKSFQMDTLEKSIWSANAHIYR